MSEAIAAILDCDIELAESLRGTLTKAEINKVIDTYHRLGEWQPKDVAIHLLQDADPDQVQAVMHDALNSPTVETRAIAYCSLCRDFAAFNGFLRKGFVDPSLVNQAIQSKFSS